MPLENVNLIKQNVFLSVNVHEQHYFVLRLLRFLYEIFLLRSYC
jgi:hypothetical protein